jgi:predicted DNA-binding protein (MmcQ/YjbR family)
VSESAYAALRAHGLGFPEASEDFPWGHTALKVRGKIFVSLDKENGFGMTVKLPVSRDFALVFDFAAPAGYGLGRSGWISCRFAPGEEADVDLLKRWIAESYRAVAPKKLAALVPEAD